MADDDKRTIKEKLLFYTTAFFILLGTFSLFAFLFLVPFVIEPGFTTIFMQFDTRPAMCVTTGTVQRRGVSNCTWSSCREGCTKELFECIQIKVNYKAARNETNDTDIEPTDAPPQGVQRHRIHMNEPEHDRASYRKRRAIRDYNYDDGESYYVDATDRVSKLSGNAIAHKDQLRYNDENLEDTSGEQYVEEGVDEDEDGVVNGTQSEWFIGARLFPNVKGCGYPPSLNCTIWTKKYKTEGTNFSCYYSRVDPLLVVSDLDMWQNKLNLIYSMAIPIPSFIISVIYLAVAYFKIYSDDEEQAPLGKNAEEIADDDELGASSADCCDQEEEDDDVAGDELDDEICIVLENGSLPDDDDDDDVGLVTRKESGILQSKSNSGPLALTNSTDLASSIVRGGAAGANEEAGSRGSTEHGVISNSGSIPGYKILIEFLSLLL